MGMHFSAPPPERRKEVLSTFSKQKSRDKDMREEVTMVDVRPDDNTLWRITLTLENIEEAWQKGLSRPLETARCEITRLVTLVKRKQISKPLVVVSGGTARNPAVKSRMLDLCRESGVPVLFTDDFAVSITYE